MKKRNRLFLANKAETKKYKGLSAELQERIKKAKQGQGIIIGREHYPRSAYKTGTIVDILLIDNHDNSADCRDAEGSLVQWVSLKDMIIKGK